MISFAKLFRGSRHAKECAGLRHWLRICVALGVGFQFGFASGLAQQEAPEPPLPEQQTAPSAPDPLLRKISGEIQKATNHDVAVLARALHIAEGSDAAMTDATTLTSLGDLDGDGVEEMLLKMAVPDANAAAELAPAPDSQPLWGLYLLSWNRAHWNASTLLAGVDRFHSDIVELGGPVGKAIALVVGNDNHASAYAYPVIFEVKQHAAKLLWDSRADESRYEPLLQGQINFQDKPAAPAEMIVSGRADPGLLRVSPKGSRGFRARAVYCWDGGAFVPLKNEYSAGEDYSLYRFISALHLHDYRSAYSLVLPARLMNTGSPTLDAFRKFIQNDWPEFLQDDAFSAPEAPEFAAGHAFLLDKPGKRYVYHPSFSDDGRFLLTGLTRQQETVPAEP